MQIKRRLTPKTRHVHGVTIADEVWDALMEHCVTHNIFPGEVIEASLRKQLEKELKGGFG